MSIYPSHDTEYSADQVREIAARMQAARTQGELGTIVTREVQKYSLFDLQIIGGRLNTEIERLPSPYRESIRPYFREQLFGRHHLLLAMHRSRAFERMGAPIRNRERFDQFCGMLPEGTLAWDDSVNATPISGTRRTASSTT